jgi:hypothetical protein
MINVSNHQKVFLAQKAEKQKVILAKKGRKSFWLKSHFWPKVISGQKSSLAIIHFWLKSNFWPKSLFWLKSHFWPKKFLNKKRIHTVFP